MQIFDGRAEAKKLDQKISEFVTKNPTKKQLAIVQIGDNESSEKYVNIKQQLGKKLGIDVVLHKLEASLGDPELVAAARAVFNDEEVGGVIVQLPLPRGELNVILDKIPPEKDIDALSDRIVTGYEGRHSPVVRSAEHFIYSMGNDSGQKKAIIVGGGKLVGKPVAEYLEKRDWQVEIDENYTRGKSLEAQLVVLSVGVANLVSGEDISDGAGVIDFGSSVVDGKVVGDLDMNTSLDHLGLVSPSPGGMGPLTVRYLFLNFLGI